MTAATTDGVSVVVCTYDIARLDLLVACLDSVQRQSLPPSRVVVVVDGSADLAAALRRLERPETLVPLERNVGLSGARNAGVEQVDSRWVAFLDDDAVADPHWLERLVNAAEATDAAGSGGWSAPLFDDGMPVWFPAELLWTVGCSYEGLPTQRAMVRNVFGGCAMFRTELLREHGGFDTTLGRMGGGAEGGEEAEFCVRVAKRDPDARFVHEPEALIHHHVPPTRARVSYVVGRCYAEGRSKGRVARLQGRGALSSESTFVRGVPAAAVAYVRRRRPGAAAVLLAGVAAAAGGYVVARVGPVRGQRVAPEAAPSAALK